MSTAIARVDELTPDRVALLKRTLCPDLTDTELELLAGVARRSGLDPFARQIYGIKRQGKLCIQTGIDGFRVIAGRTGELDGQEGPMWCGQDGVWVDVWLAKDAPAAAKVIVYRKGCRFGFVGIARTSEYAAGGPMWQRMPATMIAKCAEALALRKAFPQDLSGLYTSEEMEQADAPDVVQADAPKQLPAAKPAKPKGDGIDRTADNATRAAAGQQLGNPLNDTAAIRDLATRKGYTMAAVVESINSKFKTTYTPLKTPWGDIADGHRKEAIAKLAALPDVGTASDLRGLIDRLAGIQKTQPDYVFLKYAQAAELHECITNPEEMTTAQLAQACKSFRAKFAAMDAEPEKGGAA